MRNTRPGFYIVKVMSSSSDGPQGQKIKCAIDQHDQTVYSIKKKGFKAKPYTANTTIMLLNLPQDQNDTVKDLQSKDSTKRQIEVELTNEETKRTYTLYEHRLTHTHPYLNNISLYQSTIPHHGLITEQDLKRMTESIYTQTTGNLPRGNSFEGTRKVFGVFRENKIWDWSGGINVRNNDGKICVKDKDPEAVYEVKWKVEFDLKAEDPYSYSIEHVYVNLNKLDSLFENYYREKDANK